MRRRHHMADSCDPEPLKRMLQATRVVGASGAGGGVIEPAQKTISGMEPARATILVIEDHRPTRTFLADNLSADGHDVLEAESIADARRLMEKSFPDAAIVDLGLPDGDGLDLLRQVRETDRVAGALD